MLGGKGAELRRVTANLSLARVTDCETLSPNIALLSYKLFMMKYTHLKYTGL